MLILLHYFLVVVQSAPVGSADLTLDLTDVTERAKTLVQKILNDIPVAHAIAVSSRVGKASGWLLQVLSDWLLAVKALPLFPSGSDSGVQPAHEPAGDDRVPGSPRRPPAQTAIRTLHPGQSALRPCVCVCVF